MTKCTQNSASNVQRQFLIAGEHIRVLIEDLSSHPQCPHGPALLFQRTLDNPARTEEFFACSACRSPNECSFRTVKKGKDAIQLPQCRDRSQFEYNMTDQDNALLEVISNQMPRGVERIASVFIKTFSLLRFVLWTTNSGHFVTHVACFSAISPITRSVKVCPTSKCSDQHCCCVHWTTTNERLSTFSPNLHSSALLAYSNSWKSSRTPHFYGANLHPSINQSHSFHAAKSCALEHRGSTNTSNAIKQNWKSKVFCWISIDVSVHSTIPPNIGTTTCSIITSLPVPRPKRNSSTFFKRSPMKNAVWLPIRHSVVALNRWRTPFAPSPSNTKASTNRWVCCRCSGYFRITWRLTSRTRCPKWKCSTIKSITRTMTRTTVDKMAGSTAHRCAYSQMCHWLRSNYQLPRAIISVRSAAAASMPAISIAPAVENARQKMAVRTCTARFAIIASSHRTSIAWIACDAHKWRGISVMNSRRIWLVPYA